MTVLRDGNVVSTAPTDSVSESELVSLIMGRTIGRYYPSVRPPGGGHSLAVTGLAGAGVKGVSFEARSGEILGLTGLLGMGYEQVPYLMFGATPASSGELTIGDRVHNLKHWDPMQAMKSGIALLPGNRLRAGGLASASVIENVTLPTVSRYFRRGFLRHRKQRSATKILLERFNVRPPEPLWPFAQLSGGNQQKALVAKWFETNPRVFLFHEPTQGVDVGSKPEIFRQIRAAADGGATVVIASCEYEDLAHLCNRVLIFHDGLLRAELSGDALTTDAVVDQSFLDLSKSDRRGDEQSGIALGN